MDQKAALGLGALAGAAGALLLGRRRRQVLPAPPTGRASSQDDLQAKLAEAREGGADETEFEAAGMAGETIVAEEPSRPEPAPANEFEAMRRRVHEEARAAAEEMRRRADSPD